MLKLQDPVPIINDYTPDKDAFKDAGSHDLRHLGDTSGMSMQPVGAGEYEHGRMVAISRHDMAAAI